MVTCLDKDNVKHMLEVTNNIDDNNALHYYFINESNISVDIVKLLIDYGVDITHRNLHNRTPLGEYSLNHNIDYDIVLSLLYVGESSNINDIDIYAYITSPNIDIKLLKFLINNGIDLTIKKNNLTLLERYVMLNCPKINVIELLLDNTQTHKDGWSTTLHKYIISHSYYNISIDIIKYLISRGISPALYDDNNHVPIQYYIRYYPVIEKEIVELLVEGVNTSYTRHNKDDYSYGDHSGVLNDYLFYQWGYGDINLDIIKMITKNGTPKNIMECIVSYEKREYNYENIDKILSVLSKDVIQTMLMYYLKNNIVNVQIIKLMLKNGASLNKVNGYYPLHKYFNNDNVDIYVLEYLLSNGDESINQLDEYNELPIVNIMKDKSIYPSHNYDEDYLVKLITVCIKYIKDINMRDEDGETLLTYAIRYNKQQLAKLLIDNGAK
ncbi:ankyrin-repeat protein [NY_014 poxvirus]|uniref:ankyrin-repeat protein n=1 Tax=NY_014 poxvirus TaxID=2025360 RepID=UPI000B99F4FE|nr:ankyrin-repeat protein [NY_014 poxvirus]AST09588.1 ankyrin-repeat protein [NY_014 poxvirus]